jgi:hypothetical protein
MRIAAIGEGSRFVVCRSNRRRIAAEGGTNGPIGRVRNARPWIVPTGPAVNAQVTLRRVSSIDHGGGRLVLTRHKRRGL